MWLVLRGIVLALVGPLIMACATSTPPVALQQPREIKTKAVLETCAVVQDQDLAEMRGCYDTYSFGMNITGDLDLGKAKNFRIQTNYTQVVNNATPMPSQVTVSSTGNQVNFSNANVAYTAGVGQNSLGTGIMQVVQVAGQNISVAANMAVTLNINNAISLKTNTAGGALQTPATLAGIFM